MEKCALVITGHIRDGFKTNSLNDFIKLLSKNYEVDLYIHTWEESEACESWRVLDRRSLFEVTESIVRDYFDEPIKEMLIENEYSCKINGMFKGKIGKTRMPVRGWKKMITGMKNGIKLPKNSGIKYDFVIRTRFDYFSRFSNERLLARSFGPVIISTDYLLKNIENHDRNQICFLPENVAECNKMCIDNFFLGDLEKINTMLEYMSSSNIDNILRTKFFYCQEAYFYPIAELINRNQPLPLSSQNSSFAPHA